MWQKYEFLINNGYLCAQKMKSLVNIRKGAMSNAIALACNLLLMYVVYALCRVVFVAENWNVYKDTLFQNSWGDLIKGSLTFDTSAILYTNSLYALMMLLPFTFVTRAGWRKVAKWIFIVTNTICTAFLVFVFLRKVSILFLNVSS